MVVLKIENLYKTYGDKQVLTDVSFEVESGRTLGLLGRNGHGKSTIMKIIMGIIYSNSGEVTLDGKPLSKTGLRLGYLPEERGLYQKIKIVDQMVYFGKLRGMSGSHAKARATELLEKLDMMEYVNSKPTMLSKGNQQKIQLALAMLNEPEILILDEPYSGLDPVNSRLLQMIIAESASQNKIILFSSHQLNTVEEFCRDICIINHGETLLKGNLRDIKSKYPQNRLLIIPDIGHENELQTIIQNMEEEYENVDDGIVINLKNRSKNDILGEILTKTSINSFKIVEPTLLEIFLEKVGENE